MLGAHVSPTVCCVGATPAPVAVKVADEFVALLLTENRVDVEPLLVGLKLTPTETLVPAAMVLGNVRPLKVNSWLVVVAVEIVIGPALAVRVAVLLAVVPTVTLPKLIPLGEMVRLPDVEVLLLLVVVLPESGTYNLPPVTHSMVSIAEKLPLLFGTNFTAKVMLLLEPKLNGEVIPDSTNALDWFPFIPTQEICATLLVMLVNVTD